MFKLVRTKLIILLALLVVCGLLSGYITYRNKPSASGLVDTKAVSPLNSIANLTIGKQTTDSLPTIKLPATYSDVEVVQALSETKPTTRSTIDRGSEILNSITKQVADLVAKEDAKVKSGDHSVGNSSIGDLVINVRDSKGKALPFSQSSSTTRTVAPATAADNFDFDASVTLEARQSFISSYTTLESFLGPRENTRKIHVFYDSTLEGGDIAGYFMPEVNIIHYSLRGSTIDSDDSIAKELIAHELTHAFFGDKQLPELWNEGIASTVPQESRIVQTGGLFYGHDRAGINNDSRAYPYSNAADFERNFTYIYGSRVMAKLFLEKHDFFKQFTAAVFNTFKDNSEQVITSPALIAIAASILPTVEHETTYDWLSQQYQFIESDIPDNDDNNHVSAQFAIANYPDKSLAFQLHINAANLAIKAYDANNNLVVNCQTANTSSQISSCQSSLPNNYIGWIKTVVTPDGNDELAHTYYRRYMNFGSNLSGIVVGYSNAKTATVTNLETGWTKSAQIINGTYNFDDGSNLNPTAEAGRYKVDIKDQSKVLTTKYFNKTSTVYTLSIINLPNDCQTTALDAKSTTTGIHLTAATNKYCSSTVFVNKVPVARTFSKNYTIDLDGLPSNVACNITFATGDDWALPNYTNITATPNAPFAIVKQENIGVASLGTFRRRITFNYPPMPSFKPELNYFSTNQKNYALTLGYVDKYTLDLIPSENLLDNVTYTQTLGYVESVDHKFLSPDSVKTTFTTPPAPVVSYSISAKTTAGGALTPSGTIKIIKGGSQKYVIAPSIGYKISDVSVDNRSVGVITDYAFYNLTADHTISASFVTNAVPCKPAAIVPAGTGPASTVKVGGKFNIPIKVTNNNPIGSSCPTVWGLVIYPSPGWSTYGYSSGLYIPFTGASYRVITVNAGESATTSVTLNAPGIPSARQNISLKIDDYPAGKLITTYSLAVAVTKAN